MQAILFDIDGTLLSSLGAGKDAMYQAIREVYGQELPRDSVPFAGCTDRSILTTLIQACGEEATDVAFAQLQTVYLRYLPETLQRDCPGVLPGIQEALDRLGAHNEFELGLLTGNMRRGSDLKLQRFGIYDYFKFGGWGDQQFGRNEVAHEALVEVRGHLGAEFPAAQVWVIGDTPKDVECAHAIGAKAVAVATGPYSFAELAATGAEFCLHDFSEADDFWRAIDI